MAPYPDTLDYYQKEKWRLYLMLSKESKFLNLIDCLWQVSKRIKEMVPGIARTEGKNRRYIPTEML
ncbi:MAG: hypothetical protein JO327_02830 [Nitrososphaeraceae archaeon]|nr:hypothetical protein [Nitrososphaeraceae archaeon]MBV9667045.1 hypothetical protein [Nitrososphaeraceae archaeon]